VWQQLKWKLILRRQIVYYDQKNYHHHPYVYLQQIQQSMKRIFQIRIDNANENDRQIIVVYHHQQMIVRINRFHM
jgi:hypothetical protein